jgi:hypothetical protein
VSDSFAPDESTAKFETRSGFAQFWINILLGLRATVYSASFIPDRSVRVSSEAVSRERVTSPAWRSRRA